MYDLVDSRAEFVYGLLKHYYKRMYKKFPYVKKQLKWDYLHLPHMIFVRIAVNAPLYTAVQRFYVLFQLDGQNIPIRKSCYLTYMENGNVYSCCVREDGVFDKCEKMLHNMHDELEWIEMHYLASYGLEDVIQSLKWSKAVLV